MTESVFDKPSDGQDAWTRPDSQRAPTDSRVPTADVVIDNEMGEKEFLTLVASGAEIDHKAANMRAQDLRHDERCATADRNTDRFDKLLETAVLDRVKNSSHPVEGVEDQQLGLLAPFSAKDMLRQAIDELNLGFGIERRGMTLETAKVLGALIKGGVAIGADNMSNDSPASPTK